MKRASTLQSRWVLFVKDLRTLVTSVWEKIAFIGGNVRWMLLKADSYALLRGERKESEGFERNLQSSKKFISTSSRSDISVC